MDLCVASSLGTRGTVLRPEDGGATASDREGYMKGFGSLIVLGVLCAAGGCTSYYKVHDPTSGKDYYTNEVKQESSGAASLKDARTGDQVVIQNSEVAKISEEQFKTGMYSAKPPTTAQPTTPTNPATPTANPATPF